MTREEAMIKVLAKENDELKSKISELISAQEYILDKIRAEIEQKADEEQNHDGYEKWVIGMREAVKIIDKYKAKSEE